MKIFLIVGTAYTGPTGHGESGDLMTVILSKSAYSTMALAQRDLQQYIDNNYEENIRIQDFNLIEPLND